MSPQLSAWSALARALLGASRDPVCVTDADGRITASNPALVALSGWGTDELEGAELDHRLPLRARGDGRPLHPIAHGAGGDEPFDLPTAELETKGGRRVGVSVRVVRMLEGETLMGTCLSFRDLAPLETLERQREQLDFALESAELGQWYLDLGDQSARRTLRHDQIFGYSTLLPEWSLPIFLDHVVPAERAAVEAAFMEAIEVTGVLDLVCRIRRTDGEVRWIWTKARSRPATAERPAHMLGIVGDLTERKAREEAARDARSRLESVLATGSIGTWEYDVPAGTVQGDRNLARMFGVSERDADGGPIDRYLEAIHPDDRERVAETIGRSIASGDFYEADYRLVSSDGAITWVTARGRVDRDAAGVAQRMPGVVIDISSQHAAAERQRALTAALEKSNRQKDVFLATLAHELRNPLAPLRNALALIERAGDDPATVRGTREMMQRQLAQLIRLVDDLLDVNRIERDRLELRVVSARLRPILENAVETIAPLIAAKGHELKLDLPSESLTLDCDPARLAQVFTNLLDNAAKYTPPGGHIELGVSVEDEVAVVHVRDDGPGIPTERLAEVFELFTQLDSERTKVGGGLGIGLTLARRLLALHGAELSADSEGIGRGATFTARLPLSASVLGPAPAKPRRGLRLERLHVLVADDNVDSADTLRMLFEHHGARVSVAHDGAEALERAQKGEPAVLVLDIGMPELDGHEVCRAVRDTEWGRGARLIAVTGWGQQRDREATREAGFDHHLVKPVDADALLALVARGPRGPDELPN